MVFEAKIRINAKKQAVLKHKAPEKVLSLQSKPMGLTGFDSEANGYCKHAEPCNTARKTGLHNNNWR
jgi:hypothetical protein